MVLHGSWRCLLMLVAVSSWTKVKAWSRNEHTLLLLGGYHCCYCYRCCYHCYYCYYFCYCLVLLLLLFLILLLLSGKHCYRSGKSCARRAIKLSAVTRPNFTMHNGWKLLQDLISQCTMVESCYKTNSMIHNAWKLLHDLISQCTMVESCYKTQFHNESCYNT